MAKVTTRLIDWGFASQTLPGQRQSGDAYLVQILPREALVAVVDGVGHGEEAAAAGRVAIETLRAHAGESLMGLVNHCHGALRQTRGAVMSLASFDAADCTMTWLGVGNVEGVLLHSNGYAGMAQESLLLKGGLVGDCLPRLTASIVQVTEGDLLVLATDGVRPDFAENLLPVDAPQRIADRILARHACDTDDASVLVVRCLYGKDKPSFR